MKTVEQYQAQFEALSELRKPFPANQISKLPKGKGVELDYVGHAALTSRLLDVDPLWSWEPLALTPSGLPLFDELGGLWIRLTVANMTRLGYGHAPSSKTGGDRIKEVIGDALRNAAMRFGAALDLWHKGGDLSGNEDIERDAIQNEGKSHSPPPGAQARFAEIVAMFRGAKTTADVTAIQALAKAEWDDLKDLPGAREGLAGARNAALQRVQ
jgi:hypothetical protein